VGSPITPVPSRSGARDRKGKVAGPCGLGFSETHAAVMLVLFCTSPARETRSNLTPLLTRGHTHFFGTPPSVCHAFSVSYTLSFESLLAIQSFHHLWVLRRPEEKRCRRVVRCVAESHDVCHINSVLDRKGRVEQSRSNLRLAKDHIEKLYNIRRCVSLYLILVSRRSCGRQTP
jgi:hypothetical protein